jgi:hypothetical protein
VATRARGLGGRSGFFLDVLMAARPQRTQEGYARDLAALMLSLRYGGAGMLCLDWELASVSGSRYLLVEWQRSDGHAL